MENVSALPLTRLDSDLFPQVGFACTGGSMLEGPPGCVLLCLLPSVPSHLWDVTLCAGGSFFLVLTKVP